MTRWPQYRVRDICSLIVDCVNRTAPVVDYVTPYRMIRTTNVRDGRVDLSDCRYVEEDTYERWSRRAKLRDGDVVLTREAPIGEVGYISGLGSAFLGQRMMHYRPDPKRMVPRYFYYAFRSPSLRHQFGMHEGSGSVVSHIRVADCHEFVIATPPLAEQERVVEILGTLDDKIELNRRMNETLETMTQAIFRDWFVDFGPVRRKMEGATDPVAIMGGLIKDSDRARELALEFPGGLADQGWPEGWRRESVFDQAEWVNGAAYRDMHFGSREEGLPVIKIAELKAGITATTRFTATDLGSRYRVDDGELLFSWSGNPDTSIDTFIWAGGPAWLNQHIFAVRSNGRRQRSFLHALLKWLNPTFAEVARDKQTTGLGHVTKADLKRLQISVPSEYDLPAAFEELAEPLYRRLHLATLESRTLAETRDYLLPRLMSGEVCVREGALEAAA